MKLLDEKAIKNNQKAYKHIESMLDKSVTFSEIKDVYKKYAKA